MADKLKKFQENGAKKLNEILNVESRAFLADEAGLGKTFTTTKLIQLRAQEKWKKEKEDGKDPTAFVVLYVGPNQSIIRKCCKDIVKKFNAIKECDETIQFMGGKPTREQVIKGYENAFDAVLKDRSVNVNDPEAEKIIRDVKERARLKMDIQEDGESDWNQYYKKIFREALERYDREIGFKSCRKTIGNETRVQFYPTINNKYKSYIKEYVYSLTAKYDRLVLDYGYLKNPKNLEGKKILLFAASENILDIEHKITEAEKKFIRDLTNIGTKKDIIKNTIGYFHLITFDEYHKYFSSFYITEKKKVKPTKNFSYIWEKEKENKLKCLFISATPYSTNKSENVEKTDSKDILAEDEDKVIQLPSFEAFANMFCFNMKEGVNDFIETEKKYKNQLTEYINHGDLSFEEVKKTKECLESKLKTRMIRHERTMLSGDKKNEEHIIKSECDYNKQDFCYKDIICSTNREIRKLQEMYPKNQTAQKWCKTIPGVLSFSTKAKSCSTQFEDLKGYVAGINDMDSCFSYTSSNSGLKLQKEDLPKTTFPMAQVCMENVNIDEKQHQLIWMPPTRMFYSIDKKSIFAKNSDYSKLLVFGEYSFIQRGGAALISDYVRHNTGSTCTNEEMQINSEEIIRSLFKDYCEINLKSVEKIVEHFDSSVEWLDKELELKNIIEKSMYDLRQTLFLLASPFACIIRLNKQGKLGNSVTDGDEIKHRPLEKIEEIYNVAKWFNTYFQKRSNILCNWMSEQEWSQGEELQDKLLRYCAEGNLYSVLLEWCFTQKGYLECENQPQSIKWILHDREAGIVHVQVCENGKFCVKDGLPVACEFAERLTHDQKDNDGSANENEAIEKMNETFNSPFYPMILFAGRGAQEGLDFHQYCRKIDHMTIPRGAASFDQRQGRIDRYQSLLVRERACEQEGLLKENGINISKNDYWINIFNGLRSEKIKNLSDYWKEDQLFPEWQIKVEKSNFHFERMVPYLKYTTEEAEYKVIKQQLDSYRSTLGSSSLEILDNELRIDLSAQ